MISRRGMTVTVGFAQPRCGRPSGSSPGSTSATEGSISIIYAVPFGTHTCPPPKPQTLTSKDFWTTATTDDSWSGRRNELAGRFAMLCAVLGQWARRVLGGRGHYGY